MSIHHVTAAALRTALHIARMICRYFLRMLVITSVFVLQLIALRVCARVTLESDF